MPAPTSVNELLELTQKSGTVDEGRLNAYVQQLSSAGTLPQDPKKLAGLMVRDALLTFFQAEQLLMGKWKRFTIGKYRVLERLGQGGMGQVFLCEHKLMRRRVAVKVLPTAKADDPSSLERFYREARAVAALDHPNIVRAYDIDQDDNLHFLVMEYVDGSNLQDIVKKFGPMDPLRACHYVFQAAHGLQHAFDQAHLVHRDIKPGNILIDRQGIVKILDMGLARFFHDEEDLLTKKYDESVLGTADYLAPEQAIDSHSVDIRADIYSLGATFYFMLTGQPPFTEGTVAQKLIWHQTKEPTPILAIRPTAPPEIVAIVEKMMVKDMNARPQRPADVAAMLAPIVAAPIPPPPEAEMPHLSPAALGGASGIPGTAPSARISMPACPTPGQAPARQAESGGVSGANPRPMAMPASVGPVVSPSSPTVRVHGPAAAAPTAPPPVTTPAWPGPSPAAAAVAAVAAVAPPQNAEETAPIWATLTSDTPNPKAHDTVRSPVYKPPSATLQTPITRKLLGVQPVTGSKRWLLMLAVGGLILVLAIGVAFAVGLFGGKKQKGPDSKGSDAAPGPQTLIVDANAPEQGQAYRLVWKALLKAKAGDRILVRGNAVEEQWTNVPWQQIAKGLTIEPDLPPGQYMPWRLPAQPKSTEAILELHSVEGLTFRRFAFDGQNVARTGIYLSLRCPGVAFEDIQIQNCLEAAIKLNNTVGDSSRPVKFTRVRVPAGKQVAQTVLTLFANPKVMYPANEHILVQDCQFEGPCNTLVLVHGSIQDVTLQRNRFANAPLGVVVKKPVENQWYQLALNFNTFYNVGQSAVLIEGLPITDKAPPSQPGNQFAITNNYFAACRTVLTVPDAKPLPDATIKGNARDGASADGNSKLDLRVIDYKFPNVDPNAGDFLRYPRGAPLDNLPDGPVGVPPE